MVAGVLSELAIDSTAEGAGLFRFEMMAREASALISSPPCPTVPSPLVPVVKGRRILIKLTMMTTSTEVATSRGVRHDAKWRTRFRNHGNHVISVVIS